jgi:hypothetical protein
MLGMVCQVLRESHHLKVLGVYANPVAAAMMHDAPFVRCMEGTQHPESKPVGQGAPAPVLKVGISAWVRLANPNPAGGVHVKFGHHLAGRADAGEEQPHQPSFAGNWRLHARPF